MKQSESLSAKSISLQSIRALTNNELLFKIKNLAQEERRITVEVLRHLREIERRQLFAEVGYPSLFAYCTQVLKYSESAACRRIEAMRAMRETQEIETKIESGELSLSTVTQARAVMRQHEKASQTRLSAEQKKDVIFSLCGQSKREAEKCLAKEFPLVAMTHLKGAPVLQKTTSIGTTRVTIEFTDDEMNVFNEINRLAGRPQNLKDAVLRMAAKELCALRKARGEVSRDLKTDSPPPAEEKKAAIPRSRAIPVDHKRSVWRRAEGRCEYVSGNGKRREAKHSLEYDHRVPFALGGESSFENLRLYCIAHNALAATQIFGKAKMAEYRLSLR